MATEADIRAWVESTRPKDWYGICAGLTWQTCEHFGHVEGDPYPSAWAAYLSTHIESLDMRAAPAGAIHYFDYTDAGGHRYGHVMVDIRGAGTACLSATHYAFEFWGVSAGLIDCAEQSKHGGMSYVGWSYRYGSNDYVTIGDEPPAIVRDDEMKAIQQIGLPDSGVIVRGNEPPVSLPESVFVAECAAYNLTAVQLPDWQYETCIREQWAAAGRFRDYLRSTD